MRLKRLIRRLQTLRRVKVFARWDQQAAEQRHLRMATRKLAQRCMLRIKAMAWDKWSNQLVCKLLLAMEGQDSGVHSWQSQALDAQQLATEFKVHVEQLQRQLQESKVQQDRDAPANVVRAADGSRSFSPCNRIEVKDDQREYLQKKLQQRTQRAAPRTVLGLTADDDEEAASGFTGKLTIDMPKLTNLAGIAASEACAVCVPTLIAAATFRNNEQDYLRKRAQQQQLNKPPAPLRQQNEPPTEKQAPAIGATVGAKSNHQRLSADSPADTVQAGGIAADQIVVKDRKAAEQVEPIEAKDRTITKQLRGIADRKDVLCAIVIFIVLMVLIAFAPTLLNMQGSKELSLQQGVPVPASACVLSCAESEQTQVLELERAKRMQCDIELEFSKRDAQLSKREESVLRSEWAECQRVETQRITELGSCRNEVSLSHSKVQLWQDKLLACKQHNAQGANSLSYDAGGLAGVQLGNGGTLGKLPLGAPSNASQYDAGEGGEASLAPPALCKGWYCPRVARDNEPRYGVLSWRQGLQSVETGELILYCIVQCCSALSQRQSVLLQ